MVLRFIGYSRMSRRDSLMLSASGSRRGSDTDLVCPHASASSPHTRLTGFTFGKLLGRGAFSDVWVAVEQRTGKKLACKRISRSSLGDANSSAMFKRELIALTSLSHANIVSVHSVHETDAHFYIMMDLCEGGSLGDHISRYGPINEGTAKMIMRSVLSAMEYCHSQSIAHLDVKPSNILFTSFPYLMLSDFGLSAVLGSAPMGSTPIYSPPEQLQGGTGGYASDMWSCGVVLYQILANQLPWSSRALPQLIDEMVRGPPAIEGISPQCSDLIRRLLDLNPVQRISAADALRHEWFAGEKENLPLQANAAMSDPLLSKIQRNIEKKPPQKLRLTFELL